MSDGGLLQKALEQQEKDNSGNNELMDAKIPVSSNTQKSDGNQYSEYKKYAFFKKNRTIASTRGLTASCGDNVVWNIFDT